MGVKWAYIFMINRYYFIDWRRMFWPVSVINTKLISGVCCCCRRCRALTMIPLVYISKSLFLVILLILIFIIIDDRSLFVCCFCFAACEKARNSLLIMINCIECVLFHSFSDVFGFHSVGLLLQEIHTFSIDTNDDTKCDWNPTTNIDPALVRSRRRRTHKTNHLKQ